MTLLTLTILGLATARLTMLITRDAILEPLRHILFVHSPPENQPRRGWYYQNLERLPRSKRSRALPWPDRKYRSHDSEQRDPGFIGELVSCPDCAGVWVGIIVAVSWWQLGEIIELAALPLALSMITSVIARRGGY